MEKSQRKRLLIMGAGGHGHVVAETAEMLGYSVSFLDDNSPEAVGRIDELEKYIDRTDYVFVAIGSNDLRKQLIERSIELGCSIAAIIHPTAYVSPSACVDEGTFIGPLAAVNCRSRIGKGCIVSAGGILDHDAVLEPYVHIDAGVSVKVAAELDSALNRSRRCRQKLLRIVREKRK